MKSKIKKFAVSTVIIMAVLIGINQFVDSSIAFGDVLANIQNARTLSYKTTVITEEQAQTISHVMVLEPYNMRVNLEDGKILILDHLLGKKLVLDPDKKLAVVSSTAKTPLGVYSTLRDLPNMSGFLAEDAGQKQIDGSPSIGFRLTKEDDGREIIVWVDIETELPIRIEQTWTDAQSSRVNHAIINDIVFDVELDETLFSMEPPNEYKTQNIDGPVEHTAKLANQSQSLTNMMQILKHCLTYVEENEGDWPNNLYDLVDHGLDKEMLVNPRQPESENGYVYLKPEGRLSPSTVILYEAYDNWSNGINVGFADGHVSLIKEEADFTKELLK